MNKIMCDVIYVVAIFMEGNSIVKMLFKSFHISWTLLIKNIDKLCIDKSAISKILNDFYKTLWILYFQPPLGVYQITRMYTITKPKQIRSYPTCVFNIFR